MCRFIDTDYVPVAIVSTEVQPTGGYSIGAENSSVINDYGMKVAETARICNESKHIQTCRAVYTDTFEKFGIRYELFYYWFVTSACGGHPLSPPINSPDNIAHIKGITYLSDYGVIMVCLGGAKKRAIRY